MARTLILTSTEPVISLSVIGLIISPLASIDISERPLDEIIFDEDLITFLGTGQIVISDGVTNFASASAALDYAGSYSSLPQNTTTIIGSDSVANNMLFVSDSSRANKLLSVHTSQFFWNSDDDLKHNDWIGIGEEESSNARYVMPFDGTIVMASCWTKEVKKNGGNIEVYVNGTFDANIFTLNTNGQNLQAVHTDINIDFLANDNLRLRFNEITSGGKLKDTIITLWTKWRKV